MMVTKGEVFMSELTTRPYDETSPSQRTAWREPDAAYGTYALQDPSLFAKPQDVPSDYVAYNPSAIWTVRGKSGVAHDIMYVRVEPNRSSPDSSHLGKSVVRPYLVDPRNPGVTLQPYYEAEEKLGEDAALTRVNRQLSRGRLEEIWLLSCVDPKPMPAKPNEVQTLCTRFYAGTSLKNLEHVADGPEWMKDIRVAQADGPLGTELELYGRPQSRADSGNITHATIASLDELTPETIAAASYIDENLLPIGSGMWGGVNDVVKISKGKYVLAAHRAWRTGGDGTGRHYESVLYGHNTRANRVVELGVLATAKLFPGGATKNDTNVNLSDVVFTGGGYNGGLDFMTFGLRDGAIGISSLRQLQRQLHLVK